jgi:hypothetical protein
MILFYLLMKQKEVLYNCNTWMITLVTCICAVY